MPNYAEGAYSTVLALNALANGLGSDRANITYATGLNIKLEPSLNFEIDFTLWHQNRRFHEAVEEPLLVFGEAKSFGTECFKQEDLDRMRSLAQKISRRIHRVRYAEGRTR